MNIEGITFAILWLITLYLLGREQERNLQLLKQLHKQILKA